MTKNKEKRGRPELPENDKRSVVVQFRCTEKEKIIMEKTAKAKGVKLSDWLRDAVLKGAN